jgi:hypothetical protein
VGVALGFTTRPRFYSSSPADQICSSTWETIYKHYCVSSPPNRIRELPESCSISRLMPNQMQIYVRIDEVLTGESTSAASSCASNIACTLLMNPNLPKSTIHRPRLKLCLDGILNCRIQHLTARHRIKLQGCECICGASVTKRGVEGGRCAAKGIPSVTSHQRLGSLCIFSSSRCV